MRLDRAACVWLIHRHLDPQAEIGYLDTLALVAAVAGGAVPFHLTTREEGPDPERTSFAINTHVADRWWVKPTFQLFDLLAIDPANP